MAAYDLLILIASLPLLSFLVLGMAGKSRMKHAAGIFASLSMLCATILAFIVAYKYFTYPDDNIVGHQTFVPFTYPWLQFANGLAIDMGIMVDPISVMMIVIVTLISLMVHIYSIGYMQHDPRRTVYFSFLGLFTFSMLGLVMASNLFQMYFFWELVGVSSFLLIGYYYDRPAAVAAAKKAFIVTRFADVGFLIGILILSSYSGSLNFSDIIGAFTNPDSEAMKLATSQGFLGMSALTWGLLLIFMGGAGKSALFPLHVWLPDAMEGPTPVSALIHAATMVVAGVFLIARLFPVYLAADPETLQFIGYTGAVTALIAAFIACTQTDIKRVLAYSTMSQIGFMVLALGMAGFKSTSAFTASMFHLFTHALFKALLFLAAGAVIHYVHNNDLRAMGGLRKYMPITHVTFLIACLAIAGIPPFAGFFSKEEILLAAYNADYLIYGLALITSGLTAYYMFRLYFRIFWNKPFKTNDKVHGEGGVAMMLPLAILAVCTLCAGFIPFGNFVSADGLPYRIEFHLLFSIAPVSIALAAIAIAWILYGREKLLPDRLAIKISEVYRASYHKLYFDEIYTFVTKRIIFNLVARPIAWFDKHIVDGSINGFGALTKNLSFGIRSFQSGRIQDYVLVFLVAATGLSVLFMFWWT